MAKRPAVRDELGMPAAALLLVLMLLTGFPARPAFAGSEGAEQVPRALDGVPPVAGTNGGEAVQPSAGEAPKEASSTGVPAAAKAAGAGPEASAPASTAAPQEPAQAE